MKKVSLLGEKNFIKNVYIKKSVFRSWQGSTEVAGVMNPCQTCNWKKCPGGAKPACAITLEGQQPHLTM